MRTIPRHNTLTNNINPAVTSTASMRIMTWTTPQQPSVAATTAAVATPNTQWTLHPGRIRTHRRTRTPCRTTFARRRHSNTPSTDTLPSADRRCRHLHIRGLNQAVHFQALPCADAAASAWHRPLLDQDLWPTRSPRLHDATQPRPRAAPSTSPCAFHPCRRPRPQQICPLLRQPQPTIIPSGPPRPHQSARPAPRPQPSNSATATAKPAGWRP